MTEQWLALTHARTTLTKRSARVPRLGWSAEESLAFPLPRIALTNDSVGLEAIINSRPGEARRRDRSLLHFSCAAVLALAFLSLRGALPIRAGAPGELGKNYAAGGAASQCPALLDAAMPWPTVIRRPHDAWDPNGVRKMRITPVGFDSSVAQLVLCPRCAPAPCSASAAGSGPGRPRE